MKYRRERTHRIAKEEFWLCGLCVLLRPRIMTQNKQTGRKTKSIVRMPATKCAHLRKRMERTKTEFHAKTQRRKGMGG